MSLMVRNASRIGQMVISINTSSTVTTNLKKPSRHCYNFQVNRNWRKCLRWYVTTGRFFLNFAQRSLYNKLYHLVFKYIQNQSAVIHCNFSCNLQCNSDSYSACNYSIANLTKPSLRAKLHKEMLWKILVRQRTMLEVSFDHCLHNTS